MCQIRAIFEAVSLAQNSPNLVLLKPYFCLIEALARMFPAFSDPARVPLYSSGQTQSALFDHEGGYSMRLDKYVGRVVSDTHPQA